MNGNEETKVAEESRRSMNIKAPSVMSVVGKLGRQPAEGRPVQVAVHRPRRAHPRRADPWHRRGAKYEIYTIINRLVAAGKAVVVISSELPELLGICDRIYTLSAGRMTGQLPVREATRSLMELMTKERSSSDDQDRAPGSRGDPEGAGARRRAPHRDEQSASLLTRNLRTSGIYIAFVAIVALFAILTDGVSLSPGNITNIVLQYSYILVLAIGMVLVIIAGHIDLSVGSVVASPARSPPSWSSSTDIRGGSACSPPSPSGSPSAHGRASGSPTSASRRSS